MLLLKNYKYGLNFRAILAVNYSFGRVPKIVPGLFIRERFVCFIASFYWPTTLKRASFIIWLLRQIWTEYSPAGQLLLGLDKSLWP